MKRSISICLIMLWLLMGLAACQRPSATPADTSGATGPQEATETAPSLTGESSSESPSETQSSVYTDLAGELALNMDSETLKQKVSVYHFVDGDTVHFHAPQSVSESGILKARFLAINTPESTGKIEEYGKTAALFTRDKLEKAAEILVESDNDQWNVDTGGERMLVWVWYRESQDAPWRNLNLEILQNGLALANSAAQNRYGAYCTRALEQARGQKLGLYSGQKDPNFYYGDAQELTLREIRLHPEQYEGNKVAFEAVVTRGADGSVYVEEYDEELDLCLGIGIYLGHDLSGTGLSIMSVGNRVRVVGTLQYYEAGGSWQISGLSYRAMKPDDPGNIQLISSGNEPAYRLIDPRDFARGQVEVASESEESGPGETYDLAYLIQDSSLRMENLHVKSVLAYSNNGTCTLECEGEGETVVVRFEKVKLPDGSPIPRESLEGETISVQGLASCYNHQYQITVLSIDDIQFTHLEYD